MIKRVGTSGLFQTAIECARVLNYLCEKEGLSLPNPEVGVQKPYKNWKDIAENAMEFDDDSSSEEMDVVFDLES